MKVQSQYLFSGLLASVLAISVSGCGGESTTVQAEAKPEPAVVEAVRGVSRTIARGLRVPGSPVAPAHAGARGGAPGRGPATPGGRGGRPALGSVFPRGS